MKVAFISGPYRGSCEWEVKGNIEAAERVAVKYWRRGYAVICPHKNTAFFGGACDDRVWLEGDMEFLRRSDVVVFLPNYRDSAGVKAEWEEAVRLGKEVLYEE